MTSPNPASGRVSPRPPEVSALFALASQDRDAMTVLGALQALVDRGAARWSVDADGAVHLILAHGTAFAVDPAHLTRICCPPWCRP